MPKSLYLTSDQGELISRTFSIDYWTESLLHMRVSQMTNWRRSKRRSLLSCLVLASVSGQYFTASKRKTHTSEAGQVKTRLDNVLTRAEIRLGAKAIPEEYLGVQFLYFGRVPALESDLQEICDDHEVRPESGRSAEFRLNRKFVGNIRLHAVHYGAIGEPDVEDPPRSGQPRCSRGRFRD
jgi:hypothetical protein